MVLPLPVQLMAVKGLRNKLMVTTRSGMSERSLVTVFITTGYMRPDKLINDRRCSDKGGEGLQMLNTVITIM